MSSAEREQLLRMRAKAERAIDLLLAFLDEIDGDPDLEPTFGFVMPGYQDECEEEHKATKPTLPLSMTIGKDADWPPLKRARTRYIRPRHSSRTNARGDKPAR